MKEDIKYINATYVSNSKKLTVASSDGKQTIFINVDPATAKGLRYTEDFNLFVKKRLIGVYNIEKNKIANPNTEKNEDASPLKEETTINKLTIEEALLKLDPNDVSHWTKGGLPNLNVMSEYTGKKIRRPDLPAKFTILDAKE